MKGAEKLKTDLPHYPEVLLLCIYLDKILIQKDTCTPMFMCVCAQSCPILCNPMYWSPPSSSVHRILQARILEWLPSPSPGDLLTQESNPHFLRLLHWQEDSSPLRHLGSPCVHGDSWVRRSPGEGYGNLGEGHGNPLQYSCLENPMDRGAWWATVHGVTKSQTQLK